MHRGNTMASPLKKDIGTEKEIYNALVKILTETGSSLNQAFITLGKEKGVDKVYSN